MKGSSCVCEIPIIYTGLHVKVSASIYLVVVILLNDSYSPVNTVLSGSNILRSCLILMLNDNIKDLLLIF